MPEIAVATLVGTAAFLAGGAFGWAAEATGFCTMGALSDAVFLGERARLRAWVLAMAAAVAGSQLLQAAGLIQLGKSIYLGGPMAWAGAVIGGVMFGHGMTLAGGCGSKTLVRLGGGNLKSLVVALVTGLFATMTIKGLLAAPRVALDQATALAPAALGLKGQDLPALLALAGMPPPLARGLAILAVLGPALAWCLCDPGFRADRGRLLGALVIGSCIPAGWAITGILGSDDFDPVPLASFSFIAPLGDGLMYLMTFTGATITFGIAACGGVVAGAFLSARRAGRFAIEGFTSISDMSRHLVGAALMGSGGVLAMGCTIGQGLSGISTLSLTSILATLSIVAGGVWGLRSLEEGGLLAGLGALLRR